MIKYEVRVYADGTKYWYLNGKPHREDGPAIELLSGFKKWYLNGKEYTKAEFKKEMASRHCASGKVDAQHRYTAAHQHIEVTINGTTYTLQPKAGG